MIGLDHRKRIGARDRLKHFCLMMLCSRNDRFQIGLCAPNGSQTRHRALQQIEGIEEVRDALEVDRRDHRAPVRQYHHQAFAGEAGQGFANWRPRQAETLAETNLVDGRPRRQFHPENFFAKTGVDARASRLLDGPNDLALTLNSHSIGPFRRARGIYHGVRKSRSSITSDLVLPSITCCGTYASFQRAGRRLEGSPHRRRRPTASGKKIEVDAFVRLGDMLDEQSLVAARRRLLVRPPLGPARRELVIGNQQ